MRLLFLFLAGCVPATDPGPPASAAPSEDWWATVGSRFQAGQGRWQALDDQLRSADARLPGSLGWDGMVAGEPESPVELRFSAYGRGEELAPVSIDAVGLGACGVERDLKGACVPRAERRFAEGIEWWSRRGGALEQGWDLESAPEGDGPVVLAVEVGGATASLSGDDVRLVSDGGRAYRLSAFSAFDAEGRELAVDVKVEADRLLLQVDDTDARWPLFVDPLLTTETWSADGGAANDLFGRSVAVGDFNGDGHDDVAVGAYHADAVGLTDAGAVYIFYGSATGPSTTAGQELNGGAASDYFGYSLAACNVIGSTTGSYDELIVGAYGDNVTAGSDGGSVSVFSGSSAGLVAAVNTTLTGEGQYDYFGKAVACAGDVNGDGRLDFLVGAPEDGGTSTGAGKAYIYKGVSSGSISSTAFYSGVGAATGDAYGRAVLGFGDTDGNAYDDVLIGAPERDYSSASADTGRVYLVRGGSAAMSSTVSTYDCKTSSSSTAGAASYCGFALAALGDVTGDGKDDFAVSAYGYDNSTDADAGRVFVVAGTSGTPAAAIKTYTGAGAGDRLGFALSAGDVDGDGAMDLVAGAYAADGSGLIDAGSVSVFHEAGLASAIADSVLFGTSADTMLGVSLATGDLNDDGYADVIAGGYHGSRVSSYAGLAMAWLGYADADNDGFYVGGDGVDPDCDDTDPSFYPGAPEVMGDALDQDCSGYDDCYLDADSDTYGTGELTPNPDGDACEDRDEVVSWTSTSSDCDDGDYQINPGKTEICDSADDDEDCDGLADDVDTSVNLATATTLYADTDGDGHGNAAAAVLLCDTPPGYVTNADDCNDTDAGISPDATEVCDPLNVDEDCDTYFDELDPSLDPASKSTFYADRDSDGYGDAARAGAYCDLPVRYVTNASDCDDTESTINPGAEERCDDGTVDEDCDGLIDDADDPVLDETPWYRDGDGDLYGDDADVVWACAAPAGMTAVGGDCDAFDNDISPGDAELCNGEDDDCDGVIDEDDAADAATWYADPDGDGDGDALDFTRACAAPVGFVDNDDDCDSADPTVYVGAIERCNGVDDDCDGGVDDADDALPEDASSWFTDSDGDGYGDPARVTMACLAPSGTVADDTDCDDTDAAVHPGARYYRDADADGEGDPAETVDACAAGGPIPPGYVANDLDCDDTDGTINAETAWYTDADGDGYGDAATRDASCLPPAADAVRDATDCDDTNDAVHPDAVEVCDAEDRDDDCDGAADDTDADVSAPPAYFLDSDADGHGAGAALGTACDAPGGTSALDDDCDDGESAINPDADELCDPFSDDEDCDGLVDDGDDTVVGRDLFYADRDGDDHGDPATLLLACEAPEGYVRDGDDCDDGDAELYPGAEAWADADGDGFGDPATGLDACDAPADAVFRAGDCDDQDPGVHEEAAEVCDADDTDEDCDGAADDADPDGAIGMGVYYVDADSDGFGAEAESRCDAGADAVIGGDCDDADPNARPGAPETAMDGIDSDCDGYELCGLDADADGYADASGALGLSTSLTCTEAGDASSASLPGDCDDRDAAVHPAAEEVVGDGVDTDCDGADPAAENDKEPEDSAAPAAADACGCGHTGAREGVLLALLGAAFARRRRATRR